MGRALTLGKAVPGVDVAVVHVHDVHALVAHEVALMPVALAAGGDTEAAHGRPVPGPGQDSQHSPENAPCTWVEGRQKPSPGLGGVPRGREPYRMGPCVRGCLGRGGPQPRRALT